MISSVKIKLKGKKMEEILLKVLLKERQIDRKSNFVLNAEYSDLQALVKKLLAAINYTRCSLQLKGKEVKTFEDFLDLFCEETGKQKWIYNDSIWSLDYLFYKYKELYKPL